MKVNIEGENAIMIRGESDFERQFISDNLFLHPTIGDQETVLQHTINVWLDGSIRIERHSKFGHGLFQSDTEMMLCNENATLREALELFMQYVRYDVISGKSVLANSMAHPIDDLIENVQKALETTKGKS